MKIKTYLIVFLFATLVLSYTKHEEQSSKHSIEQASQQMENDPKQALEMLKLVESDALNQADYWYYVLLQIRAYDLTEGNIASSLTSVTKAMDYFTQ